MKKVLFIMTCLLAMVAASLSAKAQEVTITLNPGWTWISYPGVDTLDFATALGDFIPMQGDIIKSLWGSVSYHNGQWRGNIPHFLYPGYGYMYKSNRSVPVMVTFNSQQPVPQVVVTTSEPTDITTTGAVVESTVTIEEGNHVFVRGVCWDTEEMPTMDGSQTSSQAIAGSQTVALDGLTPNTIYYVRAYAVSDYGLTYGNEVSFTTVPIWTIEATPNPTDGGIITGTGGYEENAICTLTATPNEGYIFANWTEIGEVVSTDATYTFIVSANRTLIANFTYNGGSDDHAYVDLGLPSGLLWATCNVGADAPEDYGQYFAWGETQPKNAYNWSTYQYCNGGDGWNTLTKYCNKSSFGYNGFTDNLTTLLPEDDAATANWGDGWRMPTRAEFQELYNNTTVTWTTQNGVNGRLFTASNGNTLFLPATGCRYYGTLFHAGSYGYYWSSSLHTDHPDYAWYFYSDSGNYGVFVEYRNYGQTIRPVRAGLQN